MRTLFLLLVLANAGYFAWARYLAGDEPGTDPQPLARQLEADRLKIIAADGRPGAPAPKKPPAAAPAADAAVRDAAARTVCLEWGSFAPADAAEAERRLAPLALGERLTQRRVAEQAGWWVYMPPQGSRQNAQKKAAELKALGVNDYFVVQDEGPQRWAISLGVFRTEEAAKARFEDLQKRKVRSAQVGPRETQVAKVWLQMREVEAGLRERLRGILESVPGTELRDCPAS